MKLASAQINCTVGEIQQNLTAHYQMIQTAIDHKSNLILFPEMSITGYCRAETSHLALNENDARLDKLKEFSSKGNIIIIVGAPIKINVKLYIGSFIINPDQPIQIYTKQYLHKGEELYFESSMVYNPILEWKTEKLSLAICADINNENHPCQAEKNKCSIYLPSIFYSKKGLESGAKQLKKHAEKYNLNILMSNYSGELWGMKAGGESAFWDSKGKRIGKLNADETGILFVEKIENNWVKK